MNVVIRENGQELLVKFSGDLDHHTAIDARRKIERKYQNSDLKNIIMDFQNLDFIDSSGIGFIIGRYKTAKAKDGKIKIQNANNKVKRILNMSGITKIIYCK